MALAGETTRAGGREGVELTQPRGLAVADFNHDEIPHVLILWRRTHWITVAFFPPHLNVNEPKRRQMSPTLFADIAALGSILVLLGSVQHR